MDAQSSFTINFATPMQERILGLFEVRMNVSLDSDTLDRLRNILFTELHYILTFSDQEGYQEGEGGMDADTFAEHTYQRVLRAMDHVAYLFGEGAHVIMDLNLEAYQAECFESLLQWRPRLSIGAKTSEDPYEPWTFVTLDNGHDATALLTMARVM
jgi:hypothetical protein